MKDLAERLEVIIEPRVPLDYKSPFDTNKCIYCLSNVLKINIDEFRPSTQKGRQNIVNCVPCCGKCNSSKQDKCGSKLIQWIKNKSSTEQSNIIIKWYEENEKYMLIPLDTFDVKMQKTYIEIESELDERLNKIYEEFS